MVLYSSKTNLQVGHLLETPMTNSNCDKNENIRLLTGLFFSILVHISLSMSNGSFFKPIPIESYSDLALILDDRKIEEPTKKSYVTPSESLKEEVPKKTTPFLSDKDTSTENEQIKRGDEGSISPPLKKVAQNKPAQKVIKKEAQKKEPRSDIGNNLFMDPSKETLSEISKENSDLSKETKKESKESNESLISSMAALGSGGSSNFLPGVPDGDITMLNAKADRFAVFVRRVALQVFSALKQSNWIDHPQLNNGFQTDGVRIRAILSAKGDFIKAEIVNPSGLVIFDSTVLASVRKGAWDRNPPKEALASDGNVRFIFESKAWVRMGQGRRRQWLLLGTGLE